MHCAQTIKNLKKKKKKKMKVSLQNLRSFADTWKHCDNTLINQFLEIYELSCS